MFSLKIFRSATYWRTNNILRCLHKTGNEIINNEVVKSHQSDEILQNLKSATDTLHLFDILSHLNEKSFNAQHVMQSLRTLFHLQKSGNSTLQSIQLTKHPQFEELCINLRRNSRSLEMNDIIEALKVLSYVGVPANSNIVHILLGLLRQQINDITLGHIIFLDFLLRKFDNSPIIEALKIALPMIFQIKINEEIDHENVGQLIELISYSSRNKIADKNVMSIISGLTLHGNHFNIDDAKTIMWSLCDLEQFKINYEKLLSNSFQALNKNYKELSFDHLLITMSKLITKIQHRNHAFYNEEFLNKCALYAIEMDVGFTKGTLILRKFNKINFVNIFLLDYLTEKIIQNPNVITNSRPASYFSIITGLSTANHQPKNWDKLKTYILENPILKSNKIEFPWMKFSVELMSLECFDKNLLEKIFNNNFLEKHLAREQNTLDYIQMLSLYQSVMILHANEYNGILPEKKFIDKAIELNLDKPENVNNKESLRTFLEYIFGGEEYVLTKMATNYGHSIDHCLVFNGDRQPVSLKDIRSNNGASEGEIETIGKISKLEDLQRTYKNCKIVSIFSLPPSHYALNFPRLKGIFELRSKTLEALGTAVVTLNYYKWMEMPEKERLPYLEREINAKLM